MTRFIDIDDAGSKSNGGSEEMNMSTESAMEVRWIPGRKTGTGTVAVMINGRTVYPDEVTITNAKDRDRFLNGLRSACPGIDVDQVNRELLQIVDDVAAKSTEGSCDNPMPVDANPEKLLADTPQHIREEAEAMLRDPDALKRTVNDLENLGVVGERHLAAMLYLTGTSRLLPKPLAMLVQGPSSSGKSYLINKVAALFPPEAVIHATQMTPQALYYANRGSLKHRFVVAGERSRSEDDDTAEKTRALREMLSEGVLTKWVTVRDPATGQSVTKPIWQEGPIAYVESTTLPRIFNEDLNRMIAYQTDESPEQTRKIIQAEALRRSGRQADDVTSIIARHHALQRMLAQVAAPIEKPWIVMRFGPALGARFPSDRLEARRVFGHLSNVIAASALFHAYQRERTEDGQIIAAEDDYRIASDLMQAPLLRTLGGVLSEGTRSLLVKIKESESLVESGFTIAHLVNLTNMAKETVRGRVHDLADAHYVEVAVPGRGSVGATFKLTDRPLQDDVPPVLPAWEDIAP